MNELNNKIIELLNKKVADQNSDHVKLPRNYFSIVLKPHLDEIISLLNDLNVSQVYEILIDQKILPNNVDLIRFRMWFYKLKVKNYKKNSLYKNLVKFNKQVNANSDVLNNDIKSGDHNKNKVTVAEVRKTENTAKDVSVAVEPEPNTFEYFSAQNNLNIDEVIDRVRIASYPTQKDYIMAQFHYLQKVKDNFIHVNKKGIISWMTRINYLIGVARKFDKDSLKLGNHVDLPDDFQTRDYTFNPSSDLIPLNPFDERYPFICKSDLFAYDDQGILYDINTFLPVPWIYMPNMRDVTGVASLYLEIDSRRAGKLINVNVLEQTLRNYFAMHSGQKMDVIRIDL